MTVPLSIQASELTKRQSEQAHLLSKDTQWPQARTVVALHPLGLQTLSIEKQKRKNQHSTHWVNVYQYTLCSARVLLIDLQSNKVTRQDTNGIYDRARCQFNHTIKWKLLVHNDGFLLQSILERSGFAQFALLLITAFAMPTSAHAQDADCGRGVALQHSFNSGASWSLCAHVGGLNGLQISNAFFRAPSDLNRSVLVEAQLSQIVLHYNDNTVEEPQIGRM
jgi:hypothetical protein